MQRAARLTVRQCQAETPVILPDEKIVFYPYPAGRHPSAVLSTGLRADHRRAHIA